MASAVASCRAVTPPITMRKGALTSLISSSVRSAAPLVPIPEVAARSHVDRSPTCKDVTADGTAIAVPSTNDP